MLNMKILLTKMLRKLSFVHDYPTEITANADLNSYTTPGIYYCPANATVATLSNCPVSVGFFLQVDIGNAPTDIYTNDKYRLQTITAMTGLRVIRSAQTSNGGTSWTWGSWGNGVSYIANNLTTTTSGRCLDARQGKALDDAKVNKTGDTMSGHLSVSIPSAAAHVSANGISGDIYLLSAASGSAMGLYDATNLQWILNHTPNTSTKINKLALSSSTSGTVGSAVSGANSKACYFRKLGNIVFVMLSLAYTSGTSTIPTNTTLFTIPEGYRPPSNLGLPATYFRGLSAMPYSYNNLNFNADGTITQSSSSAVTGIYCFAVYEV